MPYPKKKNPEIAQIKIPINDTTSELAIVPTKRKTKPIAANIAAATNMYFTPSNNLLRKLYSHFE